MLFSLFLCRSLPAFIPCTIAFIYYIESRIGYSAVQNFKLYESSSLGGNFHIKINSRLYSIPWLILMCCSLILFCSFEVWCTTRILVYEDCDVLAADCCGMNLNARIYANCFSNVLKGVKWEETRNSYPHLFVALSTLYILTSVCLISVAYIISFVDLPSSQPSIPSNPFHSFHTSYVRRSV